MFARPIQLIARWLGRLVLTLSLGVLVSQEQPASPPSPWSATQALVDYFERMSRPKPLVVRAGRAFREHQARLRQRLRESIGLSPWPERVPLQAQVTEPLSHAWCDIRRVYYQIWPGVHASGLLYLPKGLPQGQAPGLLCPHGHWGLGHAHPVVHTRCLVFAHKGYVVFSPTQNHYEDLNIGVSHQTVSVWSNMRALDFLAGLPEVDPRRIGVCGESGGGLQTQMLVALDPRVKAATIVGMTCDFREILFPHAAHCDCNHFPSVMRFTDGPEISALGLPSPVQYLTMDDWTRRFEQDNFPGIARLYAANQSALHVRCSYEPTEHTYDRSKREKTYAWMDRWLRDHDSGLLVAEPARIDLIPAERLNGLRLPGLKDDDFAMVGQFHRRQHHYVSRPIGSRRAWTSYRRKMTMALKELLGEDATLPAASRGTTLLGQETQGALTLERVQFPTEANLRVPALIIRLTGLAKPLPVVVICSDLGADQFLATQGGSQPFGLAGQGALVVLPDVRFFGALSHAALASAAGQPRLSFQPAQPLGPAASPAAATRERARAWERNAIVWGRPLLGMAATDLRAVIDGLAGRRDADLTRVRVISRDSGALATASVFAAVLDRRISALDLDFENRCFESNSLPAAPFVLRHGDVLQWVALLADRQVTLRRVPAEAGDPAWLRGLFRALGREPALRLE
jgi:hypothetical protein